MGFAHPRRNIDMVRHFAMRQRVTGADTSDATIRYRPDIDGLRAIAVLAVIIFHFAIWRGATGGFVGVDIFFVISGFLIARTIAAHEADGDGGLASFYARRFRRILPAAAAVILVCLMVAPWLYFPVEVAEIGKAASAAALFIANFHFARLGSYFNRLADLSPMLHMWSLSVEEQFYLVFPLLLVALRRAGRPLRVAVLAMLAIASFAGTMLVLRAYPSASFYLAPLRAWEFLLGALLAGGALPPVRNARAAAIVTVAGAVLIAASVVLISRDRPFPGAIALLPCLGAAAILHAGDATTSWPGRWLGCRPMRFIGLISYSLYLWHWPILVFYRLHADPGLVAKLVLILVSIAVATLSWRFVEQPFRQRPIRTGARRTIMIGLIVALLLAVLGQAAAPIAARLHPVDARTATILAMRQYRTARMRDATCFLSGFDADARLDPRQCLTIDPHRPNILIVGDSHAAHLQPGFVRVYPEFNFLQATASLCKPVMGQRGAPGCRTMIDWIFRDVIGHANLDAVIISARWDAADVPDVVRTVRLLAPRTRRLYVMGPIVEYDRALPLILAAAPRGREEAAAARRRKTDQQATDRLMAAALAGTPAIYVSTYHAVCPLRAPCLLWSSPDRPLQFDYGHLTTAGATIVVRRLGPELALSGLAAMQ